MDLQELSQWMKDRNLRGHWEHSEWAQTVKPFLWKGDEIMTINSTSKPFALNTPQSFAASSGKAVMVKPALEMRTLVRRSCA